MSIEGRDIEVEGFPSGTDYGFISKWCELDKGDYIMAFCIRGDKPELLWVIETREGEVLSVEERKPFHDPIFGLDQMEWNYWLNEVSLPIADAHIEAKKNEASQG